MQFYKYHGAGNDFIMVDNRTASIKHQPELFQAWCNRRIGIGADGVILLNNHSSLDFDMRYYNANGYEGSMCGNGGRCIIAFAHKLGLFDTTCRFMAYDGEHEGAVLQSRVESPLMGKQKWIGLKMAEVNVPDKNEVGDYILDTGSPHYIRFVDDLNSTDVARVGKAIRYNETYKSKGINVNFIEPIDQSSLKIGTYERGVEAVTLACGTGSVAAAICLLEQQKAPNGTHEISVMTDGGSLEISLTKKEVYQEVWLRGPAVEVYKGGL